MKDTAGFLLKVLALSAALSVLIKAAGGRLSVQMLEARSLNYLAIGIIILPSVIVGTLLALSRLSHNRPSHNRPSHNRRQ